jgi:type I restriction enzyme S subunit
MIAGNGAHLGYVHHYDGKFNAYQRTYVLNNFKCDSNYLENCIRYYLPNRIRLEKKEGNMPYIVLSTLTDMTITTPPTLAEQQKIASCLSAMDDLIAAQAEKVEALKEKKTGLMQQLFPQHGETTPRLRFPEFTGEWKMKKLGEILVERKEVSVITRELPQLSFTIAEGVIKPEDRKTNQRDFLMIDKDNKRFSVTRRHDIIYNPANVVYGAIHKNNLCDGVVSPIYKIFWTKENADFINHLLRRPEFITQLASRAEGTVTKLKTLKAEAFLDMFVPFPITPSEQEKIADCLSALDAQIAAETEKLTALKDYKKGLMQQLFPQPAK